MLFAVPMKWPEPTNRVDVCRFSCESVVSFSNYKLRLVYQNLNSVMKQIPHDENLPFPEPPENGLAFLEQMESKDGSSSEAIRHAAEDQYVPEERTSEPK